MCRRQKRQISEITFFCFTHIKSAFTIKILLFFFFFGKKPKDSCFKHFVFNMILNRFLARILFNLDNYLIVYTVIVFGPHGASNYGGRKGFRQRQATGRVAQQDRYRRQFSQSTRPHRAGNNSCSKYYFSTYN